LPCSLPLRGVARAPAVARQSEKTDKIVDMLKDLTLLEASELVKQIEETFGVDASASGGGMMMMAAAPAAAEEDAAPEQSEFDVIIKEVPKDKKIAVLKVVRNLLGVGLKEAKEKVDNPGMLMEKKPKAMAEDAKKEPGGRRRRRRRAEEAPGKRALSYRRAADDEKMPSRARSVRTTRWLMLELADMRVNSMTMTVAVQANASQAASDRVGGTASRRLRSGARGGRRRGGAQVRPTALLNRQHVRNHFIM
jgi:large subunit ribosomal protein L7/L12